MLDIDTFLTTVYVMADDFCKQDSTQSTRRPGPAPSLSPSEVITLGLFAQWGVFATERAFYRYTCRRLRSAFPGLPHRSQFNRLLRQQADRITQLGHWLASELDAQTCAYETLDGFGVATRNSQRRS